MQPAPKIIEHLQSFNRKERFILLSRALGVEAFCLDPEFRRKLEQILNISVPDNAFVAMDYHLDWIQVALYLAEKNRLSENDPAPGLICNKNLELFKANHRDIDLLIGFQNESDHKTHLMLIEAKGDTGWTNKQLLSKVKRLKHIFRKDGPGVDLVVPHLVLMSPRESERIYHGDWPSWMKPNGRPLWLELPLPKGLRKITRCQKDEKQSKEGEYLRIDDLPAHQ